MILLDFFGRGQAKKDLRLEVEEIKQVRHTNLVYFLMYCVEGVGRIVIFGWIYLSVWYIINHGYPFLIKLSTNIVCGFLSMITRMLMDDFTDNENL